MNQNEINNLLEVGLNSFVNYKRTNILGLLKDSFTDNTIAKYRLTTQVPITINKPIAKLESKQVDNDTWEVSIVHKKAKLRKGIILALGDDVGFRCKIIENKIEIIEELNNGQFG